MTERSVVLRLRASTTDFVAAMGRAGTSVKELRQEIDKASKTDKGRAALNDLARTATATGLVLVAGFGAGVTAAARFEKQMSEVSAVANANAKDLKQLSGAALEAGQATQFSATEAAKAEAELAKAGIGTADILGGALAGSLDLAAAGSLDLAEAAETAARVMNIFKLGGADVGHVADVLAAGANKSAADVHQLGEALRMGGLAASSAGLSLEDTVGVLSAFHDRALIGSDAGTSLKTMLQFLSNPTAKAANMMRRLGLEVFDASGEFVGITDLAGQLKRQLGGLTTAEREAALATIFGSDAKRAALVLYELGADGIGSYINAVDDSGAATDVARKKTDNLVGDLERLRGSLETVAIESGGGATTGLRKLSQAGEGLVNAIGNMPPALSSTLFLVGGLTGGALLLLGAMLKAKTAVGGMLESLADVGPRSEKAARGLGTVAKWAGRAGAAFVALEVVSAVASTFGPAAADTDLLAASLKRLADEGERAGELTRVFGSDLDQLQKDLKLTNNIGGLSGLERGANIEGLFVGLPFMKLFDSSAQSTLERMKALDAALAQLAQSGNARQAAIAFDLVRAKASALGLSTQQLNELFPQYTAVAGNAAAASDLAAQGQHRAADVARVLAQTWADAVKEGKSLADLFDELNGGAIGWARANIAVEDALANLKETIKENKKSLDTHTDSGRANLKAILDMAEASRDAVQAKLDETHSIEDANKVYQEYRQRLVDALVPLVGSRKAAEELADQYLHMPTQVVTDVQVQVSPFIGPLAPAAAARAAAQAASELQRELSRYQLSIPVGARSSTSGKNKARRWGGIDYAMAGGGTLTLGAFIADSPTVLLGERATRREAYIPENGDHARNMRTLTTAAAWEGQQLVPMGGGMSPAMIGREIRAALGGMHATVNVYVGGQPLDERIDTRVEYAMDATAGAVLSGVRA